MIDTAKWLEDNRGMLVSIVNTYQMNTSKFSREDLEQEAALAAISAIGCFDESKGESKLSTYIYSAVSRSCRDFVRRNKNDLYVSDYYQNKDWVESKEKEKEDEDKPTNYGKFGTTEGPMAVRIDSGGAIADDGTNMVESIPSGDPCGYEFAAKMEQINALKTEVEKLPRREREIVSAIHFGGKSVSAVAKEQGVTRQRIDQVQRRAVKKLSNNIKAQLGHDILI